MKLSLFFSVVTMFFVLVSCKSDEKRENEIVKEILATSSNSYDFDTLRNKTIIGKAKKSGYKEAQGVALLKKAIYLSNSNKPDSAYVILKDIENEKLLQNSRNPESQFQFLIFKTKVLGHFNRYQEAYSLVDYLLKEYKDRPVNMFRIYDAKRVLDGNTNNADYTSLSKAYYYSKKFLQSDLKDYNEDYEKNIIESAYFTTSVIANYFILKNEADSSRLYTPDMIKFAPKIKNNISKTFTYIIIANSFSVIDKDYKKARMYFDSARTTVDKNFSDNLGVQANFNYGMAGFFQAQKMQDSAVYYMNRQVEVEKKLQKPNENAQKTMDKVNIKVLDEKNRNRNYIIALFTTISCFLLYLCFHYYRRYNRISHLDRIDVVPANSSETESEELSGEKRILFDKVIKAAENNSTELVPLFSEYNSHFIGKILNLDETIKNSELRFLIYIYLNYSTKEIAQFTNTSVRTVQTRKYILRKKYKVPSDMDIYIWVKGFTK